MLSAVFLAPLRSVFKTDPERAGRTERMALTYASLSGKQMAGGRLPYTRGISSALWDDLGGVGEGRLKRDGI